MKYYRPEGFSTQVLEIGKSKVKVSANPVSEKGFVCVCTRLLPCYIFT